MKAEEWQHAQRWLDDKPQTHRRYRDSDPETLTEYAREFAAEQLLDVSECVRAEYEGSEMLGRKAAEVIETRIAELKGG